MIRAIEFLINNLVTIGGKVTSMPYHKLHRTTSFMASPPLLLCDATQNNGKWRTTFRRRLVD